MFTPRAPSSNISFPYRKYLQRSSVLEMIEYSAVQKILRVHFKQGKHHYDYIQVPISEYHALIRATSAGMYYATHIKTIYAVR